MKQPVQNHRYAGFGPTNCPRTPTEALGCMNYTVEQGPVSSGSEGYRSWDHRRLQVHCQDCGAKSDAKWVDQGHELDEAEQWIKGHRHPEPNIEFLDTDTIADDHRF